MLHSRRQGGRAKPSGRRDEPGDDVDERGRGQRVDALCARYFTASSAAACFATSGGVL
jgi:hypothetical protein